MRNKVVYTEEWLVPFVNGEMVRSFRTMFKTIRRLWQENLPKRSKQDKGNKPEKARLRGRRPRSIYYRGLGFVSTKSNQEKGLQCSVSPVSVEWVHPFIFEDEMEILSVNPALLRSCSDQVRYPTTSKQIHKLIKSGDIQNSVVYGKWKIVRGSEGSYIIERVSQAENL